MVGTKSVHIFGRRYLSHDSDWLRAEGLMKRWYHEQFQD
jgi:hypothetical protein